MSSITPTKHGYRAQIKKKGIRDSRIFDTKAEALAWGATREAEIIAGKRGALAKKVVRDIFDERIKALEKELPDRKSARWELIRLRKLSRDPLANVPLPELDQTHVADWRDRMLRPEDPTVKPLKPGSVRREWGLLSKTFAIAVSEWRWLPEHPMKGVKRPEKPEARERLPATEEVEQLRLASGYAPGKPPQTVMARVVAAFEFELETAMRAGEIAALVWADVHTKDRFVRVWRGKTRAAKRDVPLTRRAAGILKEMEKVKAGDAVFGLTASQIDAHFRKAKAMRLIDGLTFHDGRAEAITRLSKKLDILELARVVGHGDVRSLMTYYRATATDIAKKL